MRELKDDVKDYLNFIIIDDFMKR